VADPGPHRSASLSGSRLQVRISERKAGFGSASELKFRSYVDSKWSHGWPRTLTMEQEPDPNQFERSDASK
jgi:hypothetical protein